jgi:hypothetical protein
MPTFARRENVSLLRSKKRKLNVQQSFQQILAQEILTTTNGNRVSNDTPPNEPMVESCDCEENADECMAEHHDAKDNAGHKRMAEDSMSDSKTSCTLANDDSRLSEEDYDPNILSFDDDIFGFDLMSSVDGMNDDGQSLETPTFHLSVNVTHMPPTTIY